MAADGSHGAIDGGKAEAGEPVGGAVPGHPASRDAGTGGPLSVWVGGVERVKLHVFYLEEDEELACAGTRGGHLPKGGTAAAPEDDGCWLDR